MICIDPDYSWHSILVLYEDFDNFILRYFNISFIIETKIKIAFLYFSQTFYISLILFVLSFNNLIIYLFSFSWLAYDTTHDNFYNCNYCDLFCIHVFCFFI